MLSECNFFVVFISQSAIDSGWVRQEVEWAKQRESQLSRIFILPILLDGLPVAKLADLDLAGVKALTVHGFEKSHAQALSKQLVDQISAHCAKLLECPPLRAEQFLAAIDDSKVERFPEMVVNAASVNIMARTAVNLLSNYEREFKLLAESGVSVRFLIVDPDSDVAHLIYGSKPRLYRENARTVAVHLESMASDFGSGLQVRVMRHAPTMGIIAVESSLENRSFLNVQLYFLHGATGSDRPSVPCPMHGPMVRHIPKRARKTMGKRLSVECRRVLGEARTLSILMSHDGARDCPFCNEKIIASQFAESANFRAHL